MTSLLLVSKSFWVSEVTIVYISFNCAVLKPCKHKIRTIFFTLCSVFRCVNHNIMSIVYTAIFIGQTITNRTRKCKKVTKKTLLHYFSKLNLSLIFTSFPVTFPVIYLSTFWQHINNTHLVWLFMRLNKRQSKALPVCL